MRGSTVSSTHVVSFLIFDGFMLAPRDGLGGFSTAFQLQGRFFTRRPNHFFQHETRGIQTHCSSETATEDSKAISLSASILNSLRGQTPEMSCSSPVPLNLETDFYDPTTGLHSEGIWHNALVGIASLKLATIKNETSGESFLVAATHIADSLWGHAWDGVSFQRRSHSGLWDHSSLKNPNLPQPEQANYYRASTEHRCIQHGMALIFWGRLMRYFCSRDNELYYRYQPQYRLIAKNFLKQYWDGSVDMWRTVSNDQGGGTLARPSASSGKAIEGVSEQDGFEYYRAVDQAVGILACLEMMHVLENSSDDQEDRDKLVGIVKKTVVQLFREFAYGNESDIARSYLGIERNRNFWHDGWVALALVSCGRQCPECWPGKNVHAHDIQKQLGLLVDRLHGRYCGNAATTDTIWHWATSEKPNIESGNVHYCGDNALWYAINRICQEWDPNMLTNPTDYQSFWDFVHKLQSNQGLVSVADVYPQVRLHPNTELAALVLWPLEC